MIPLMMMQCGAGPETQGQMLVGQKVHREGTRSARKWWGWPPRTRPNKWWMAQGEGTLGAREWGTETTDGQPDVQSEE